MSDTLPDAVQNLLLPPEPSETPEVEAKPEPATAPPVQDAPRTDVTEVDRLVRQRDAIIREKQKLAEELRQVRESQSKPVEPAKPEPPKPQAPNPKVDPIGYLEFQRKQDEEAMRKEIEAIKEEYTRQFEAIQQENFKKELFTRVLSEEDAFRTRQPDYDEAVKFFDAQSLNYLIKQAGKTEEEAAEALNKFKSDLFLQSMQMGIPIAEAFYHSALQAGWQSQAAKKTVNLPQIQVVKDRGPQSLSGAGRAGSEAGPDGRTRITLEQYRNLPAGDPIRAQVSANKSLFRQLTEQGEAIL